VLDHCGKCYVLSLTVVDLATSKDQRARRSLFEICCHHKRNLMCAFNLSPDSWRGAWVNLGMECKGESRGVRARR
jgi:hypothetical protein